MSQKTYSPAPEHRTNFPDEPYFGGVCHGAREEQVHADLCGIICDEIVYRQQKGEAWPPPAVRVTLDVELAVA